MSTTRDKIEDFITKANNFNSTIKLTAEISETKIAFLDTKVYNGDRFKRSLSLDVQTPYKEKETFQYTKLYSRHPLGVTRGFI